MSLTKYTKKRNFSVTPEPKGKLKKSTSSLSFVVQRHKASHLHYDFRLEIGGVLKSWAVPKGPSMNPKDKRLAMMVEDHPYSYKDFKGVIPEGYGAGIVEIWDSGKYLDIDQSLDKATAEKKLKAALKAGNLKFILKGKKLKGEFALVKLKGKQENAWLLIKHTDKYATTEGYDSENETSPTSPINKWLKENKKPEKKINRETKNQNKKLKEYIKPMLAKETGKIFDSKDWLFEIKWDGYRAITEIQKGNIELYSRNGNSFNIKYPLVFNELKKMFGKKQGIILDGEIVVLNEEGRSDFQKLQHYEENTQYPLCYYVFDLLQLNGKSTIQLPLIQRKKLLKSILIKSPVVQYSDHIVKEGKHFFKSALKQNLEGVIAKKIDSRYYPGTRTADWLKIKHHKTEEAIIVGFTEPTGLRKYFGALVLAVRSADGLKYAGHTGSGFNNRTLKEIYEKLRPLIRKKSLFSERVKTNMPVTWVQPKYICEVKFTEWTADGKMRHPIFLHMREDKTTKDVIMIKKVNRKQKDVLTSEDENNIDIILNRTKVHLTNRNKLYWPDEGITKGMMIDYYQSIADYILPYLKNRPQSLKRNPNGIKDKGFFHKDAGDEAPKWVKSIKIFSEFSDKEIDYIICNNKATLAYLNNLGCIELNPWNSTVKSLDKPDYMIIDIDPAEKNTFDQVIETANAFKEVLDKIGADSYCKTSGASGLHIYVPMGKKYMYEQVKDFAELLCTIVHDKLPDFTTMERSLKKRSNKSIYLDYLQNRKGQTIAAPYSLRPHPGATVSTPLLWKEVKAGLHPSLFNIFNIPKRIKKMQDIFKNVLGKGISLEKCLSKLP